MPNGINPDDFYKLKQEVDGLHKDMGDVKSDVGSVKTNVETIQSDMKVLRQRGHDQNNAIQGVVLGMKSIELTLKNQDVVMDKISTALLGSKEDKDDTGIKGKVLGLEDKVGSWNKWIWAVVTTVLAAIGVIAAGYFTRK